MIQPALWDRVTVQKFLAFFAGILFAITPAISQTVYDPKPMKVLGYGDYINWVGDFNKDGYSDFIFAISDPDPEETSEPGQAILYLGTPAGPQYKTTFEMPDYWPETAIGFGDYNGDGFDDITIGQYWEQNPVNFQPRGAINIYYGNANGDVSSFVEIVGEFPNINFSQTITSLGDINNDGYDDLSVNSKGGTYLFYGSPNGLPLVKDQIIADFSFAFPAGDLNNDGFDDFYAYKDFQVINLFHGSANGPVIQGPATQIFQAVGDLNKDGLNDLVSTIDRTLFIYYATENGFIKSDQSFQNLGRYKKPTDLNLDGYPDFFISTMDRKVIEIYFGSSEGYNSMPSIILKPFDNYLINDFGSPGDIDNDGYPEIFKIYDSLYIYPGLKPTSFNCFNDTLIYLKESCEIAVFSIDPPGNIADYKYSISGTITEEGIGSVSGKRFSQGQYRITYSKVLQPDESCSFVIQIQDTSKPNILYNPAGVFCNFVPGQSTFRNIEVSDCGSYTIEFNVNGNQGFGSNISQYLRYGDNEVQWIIRDQSGNITRTNSLISIVNNNLKVKIPKAYQINAQQSQANTIYLGYANNTLRLTAYEPNSSKHKYLWSNGDTTRFTRVRHNVPGTYEYSVIVTNDNGCSDTAYTTIKVVDNYCPNPIKDFITQYFPQLLSQPWIQALIASTSQMYLCYNGSSVCVNPAQVPSMISNGARLGKCGVIYESNDIITAKEETNSIGALTLSASPNPTGYEFTLKINGTKGKPYALRIVNSVGSPVFMKQGITENIVRAGASFQKGVYFAEVICGQERKVIRLLKIR